MNIMWFFLAIIKHFLFLLCFMWTNITYLTMDLDIILKLSPIYVLL
jgi:hypothetical protein